MNNPNVTQEWVKEYFEYHHDGYLIAKKYRQGMHFKVGQRVCSENVKTYRQMSIKGIEIREHRVIWFYHYGYWSKKYIDHIDGNILNNRIENLREVEHVDNVRNQAKKFRGVSFRKKDKKYESYLWKDNKKIGLGLSETYEEAVIKRLKGEVTHWGKIHSINHLEFLNDLGVKFEYE